MCDRRRWHVPIFPLLSQTDTKNENECIWRMKDCASYSMQNENRWYLPQCCFDEQQHVDEFCFTFRISLSNKVQIDDTDAYIFAQVMQSNKTDESMITETYRTENT